MILPLYPIRSVLTYPRAFPLLLLVFSIVLITHGTQASSDGLRDLLFCGLSDSLPGGELEVTTA